LYNGEKSSKDAARWASIACGDRPSGGTRGEGKLLQPRALGNQAPRCRHDLLPW